MLKKYKKIQQSISLTNLIINCSTVINTIITIIITIIIINNIVIIRNTSSQAFQWQLIVIEFLFDLKVFEKM